MRLECPLCRTEVVRDREPDPDQTCPGCGALVRGGGDSAPEGVALALTQMGGDPTEATAITQALFSIPPADELAEELNIASDERDGFYRWWVFVRAPDEQAAAERLEALLQD